MYLPVTFFDQHSVGFYNFVLITSLSPFFCWANNKITLIVQFGHQTHLNKRLLTEIGAVVLNFYAH